MPGKYYVWLCSANRNGRKSRKLMDANARSHIHTNNTYKRSRFARSLRVKYER
jgi:hypothetical protein